MRTLALLTISIFLLPAHAHQSFVPHAHDGLILAELFWLGLFVACLFGLAASIYHRSQQASQLAKKEHEQ